ncbi:THUMP domain-containing class I SAM-dependent RNA methyltransferase [Hyphobacterium lacteum]
MNTATLDIFLAVSPGLEPVLLQEAREAGFETARTVAGGVEFTGGWPDVWRANYFLRGAARVLVRIAEFPAVHLSQLDKKARRIAWTDWLPKGAGLTVSASCRGSKLYHAGAVQQRVEVAAAEALGGSANADDGFRLQVRIVKNICTISLDTSGELLHRRGFKEAVVKAPMRETLAAMFLRACRYRGDEPVYDPMCGSGTFVIEAAEIASGLPAGRGRSFPFEQFPSFDAAGWADVKASAVSRSPGFVLAGSDRDAGAVKAASANAERAGVDAVTQFTQGDVRDAVPPEGPPGLVMINPPYGARIGNRKALYPVYHALGETLRTRFSGWRAGLVTSDEALARAARLPFDRPGPPVDHGGIKIRLYQTRPLP